MARTHTFKGSASAGYGYAAFIEDGQLVITEDWGRDGGVLYRGSYRDADHYLKILRNNAPKLYNSILQWYAAEAAKEIIKKVSDAPVKEEDGVRYQFKDSRDSRGNGYSGFIDEDNRLVLEYDDPRNGGAYFRGSYSKAVEEGYLRNLKVHDPVLYDDIEKYFIKHGVKDETDLKQKYGFDDATKTILFKVKLHKKNRVVHKVLVRGRFQADVIKKLMPPIPEVLTLQTPTGDVFAIRSDEISAVEFVDEFSNGIEFREV